jgi:hypothetical protein
VTFGEEAVDKVGSRKKYAKTIFFAYQGTRAGQYDENSESIKKAIKTYNKHVKSTQAKSWEDYKRTSTINKEILESINACKVFACDMTYFNDNVLFELGYAVAKNKQVIIFLNESKQDAGSKYKGSILKGYKYKPFTNSQDIATALQQSLFSDHISQHLLNQKSLSRSDIFYIKSSISTDASIELTESVTNLEKENITAIIDDTAESQYKPNEWYARNIQVSDCVLIHFLGHASANAKAENAWKSFWAGFAIGLDKKVLIAAPAKYDNPPLDYHDIMVQYQSTPNLLETAIPLIQKWVSNKIEAPAQIEVEGRTIDFDLLKLALGEGIAEQERDKVLEYFLDTPEYKAATEREKVYVIGRKGSGKSALYFKLIEYFSEDRNCFLITLKPEAHELLEDTEFSKNFSSPASKRTFFISVWRLVILSKLILSIESHLNKAFQPPSSQLEQDIIRFTESKHEILSMNAYGVIRKYCNASRDNQAASLEDVYKDLLGPMQKLITSFFNSSNNKYRKVVILADNLDKTWDATYDIDLQSELILSLLDIESSISKPLNQVELRQIFFLRKDIFELIKQRHSDLDKLSINAVEIDWGERKPRLKKILERRFKVVLDLPSDDDAIKVWSKYFANKKNDIEPFDKIMKIVIPRPRDVIVFITRLFESAFNNDRLVVEDEDFETATEFYSSVFNDNLIAETKAEFENIGEILITLQKHHDKPMPYKRFYQILDTHSLAIEQQEALIKTLFNNDYLLAYDEKSSSLIRGYDEFKASLYVNKYWPFWPFLPKISIISQAKTYLMRNRKKSAF